MTIIREKWNKMPITVKVSTAYALCSILQKCISLITMPLFTRLLTTEQYGQVTIYQSWHGILTIFLTLNLMYGSFSTAMVKFEKDREGYISTVQSICVVLSVFFLIIYLPLRNYWNVLFELPTEIMSLMVAETLCTTSLLLWSGKKRFEFKYKSVVAITLAIAIASPLLQYLLVINNDEKGYYRIIGAAVINIAIGGFFFVFNSLKGRDHFNKEYWKYAIGFNVPLLAYYLSQVVFNQSDRIMISHMVGTDKAALYGVAYTLAMVLTFILNAINNSYVPWYYGKIKDGRMKDNRNVSLAIAALMALMLLGIIWFAPEIVLVMAGEKYAEAVYVVPPVAISLLLLFYSQLFINVEFYYEEKGKLVWASIGAALVNLGLNWIFIRQFGFIAAAYTTLASYIVFVLCNYFAMRKTLKSKDVADDGFSYKGLVVLFVIFMALSYTGVIMYELLIPRVLVSVLVLATIAIRKNSIVKLYRQIKGQEG